MIAHARSPTTPTSAVASWPAATAPSPRLYRITNTAHSPYRYLMQPQEQLNAMLDSDRNGWDVLAFYHSHTHSAAYPSATDVRMAQESGWIGEYVIYVLVSLEDKSRPRRAHVQHRRGRPDYRGRVRDYPRRTLRTRIGRMASVPATDN